MGKTSSAIVGLLLGIGVSITVLAYWYGGTDPDYGSLPKIIAAGLGSLSLLPALIWAAVASFRSRMGKALLTTLACTITGFIYLNVGNSESFGHQVISFPTLILGLFFSLIITVVLLYRGLRT